MLIEYNLATGAVISAAKGASSFVELPETSASCVISDEETAEAIWFSHTNGGEVIVTLGTEGQFVSAQIETVNPAVPETPKTAEQLRIEQLEADKTALEAQLSQLNGDLSGFIDFYFSVNPEQI